MMNSIQPPRDPDHQFRELVAELKCLLREAEESLQAAMRDPAVMEGTPLEAQDAMELASGAISKAMRRLQSKAARPAPSRRPAGSPTPQQGQFLAFIDQYIMRNQSGVAPSHADFQKFFNLTPPSVNSMLIRLEQRGFIRRIPGKTRAIELTTPPEWIPPLDRPFKF